jgi:DNA-binding LacI/PurR family transcriptional regulator
VRQLSQELGVSSNTVSAALGILESERKINRRKRSGVFVHDPGQGIPKLPVAIFKAPVTGNTQASDDWNTHIVFGCLSHLAERDLSCKLISVSPDDLESLQWPNLKRQLEQMRGEFSGAIITWSPCEEEELHDFIEETGLPVIKVGRSSHRCRHNLITIDHFGAGRMAAEYVLDRLPGTFLALSPTDTLHPFPRRQLINGFFDRLQQERAADFKFEVLAPEHGTVELGYELLGKYLANNPPPKCVFAVGDMLAIGAMEKCKDLGLRVPEEICFIGTTGLDAARACRPSLAHIHQPMEQLGNQAIELLTEVFEREQNWILGRELRVDWVNGGSLNPMD